MMGAIAATGYIIKNDKIILYTSSTRSDFSYTLGVLKPNLTVSSAASSYVVTGGASGSGTLPVFFGTIDLSSNTGIAIIEITLIKEDPSHTFYSISAFNNGGGTMDVTDYDLLTTTTIKELGFTDNNFTGATSSLNSLNILNLDENNLSTIDVSHISFRYLEKLAVRSNSLTTIDVSLLVDLEVFHCHINSLSSINVGTNVSLTELIASYNPYTVIDVSTNVNLKTLYCNNTSITALDISNNTVLERLYCTITSLTSTEKDNIYIDLDANGVINGTLQLDSGRTSASDTARANLITKGWSISD